MAKVSGPQQQGGGYDCKVKVMGRPDGVFMAAGRIG